ncbi:MAG: hypothetical protein IPJ84_18685 [Bdellovibrionales bacterium]|nr:hypothetical protein [Bdellovibrionales bacterium]
MSILHYPSIVAVLQLLVFLVALSSVALFLKPRLRAYYSVLISVSGWVFLAVVHYGQWPPLPLLLLFPLVGIVTFVFLGPNRPSGRRALCYFAIVIAIVIVTIRAVPHSSWLTYMKFNYYAVGMIGLAMTSFLKGVDERLRFVFSPAHLAVPVVFPLPEGENLYQRDDSRVWCSGLVQIVKGFLLVAVAATIFSLSVAQSPESGLGIVRASGLYAVYLLIAPAVANFITGLGRLYFLNIPDCSNHLWLASSPLDFFKRENVHAYKFSIRFVYFNLLRFTRSPVVIAIIYTLLFPIYRSFLELSARPDPFAWESIFSSFATGLILWSLLLAAIVLTYRVPFFRSEGQRWEPIVATHTLMLLLFGVFALWIFPS